MAFGDLSNRYVTGMGNTNVIDDNTDSMHTGIIQYLNAAAAGNYVFNGMTISQSDAGTFTRFTVSAGSYFKNHVRQSFSQATKDLDANFNAATYTYYIFLVVDSSGTLQFRGTEAEGASETDVGDLSDGDVPIALIEINKNSADDATDRKIQYYGATAKDRGFSVTDSSGAEVLKLNTDGTIVKGSATLTLPSSSTTLVGTNTSDTLTNKTISGSSNTLSNIPTSALASSSFTISDGSNTSPVALSETLTIRGTNNEVDVVENNKTVTVGLPSTITANVTGDVTGDLTGNADTATLATKATGLNTTSNGIVKTTSGDGTISVGSLVSGDIPNNAADTSGNAATATALATARAFSITGDVTASAVNFDGTGVVTLNTAMANDSVELGTHTTGSYVAQGQTSGSGISGSVNSEGGTFTVTSNATSANTASTIVFRDTNGDFNAGTITASLTGNVTGNVTGTVSSLSNHDTGDLAEGTNKYLTLANLKPILNATLSDLTIGAGSDTITIPGDLVVTGTTTTASVETVSTSNGVVFEGPNANDFETTLVGGNASSDITITLPTTTGTVALTTSDISGNAATATKWANARNITLTGDVTGTVSIDGSTNVSLATTIAGDSVALGTDTTGNYVTSITNGNYLTGGNGGSEGAELTIGVDATNLNTASKVVARDASGNFSAGTITADLTGDVTGNADTATQAANLNNHDTGALSEGSNLYHTTERVQDVVGGQFVTNGSHTNITAAYDDDGDGAIDLSITDATIRGKISVTDSGGDGSLAYNNGTGVITYTGPSASETRAHFSAGTGVTLSSGEISIGQAVGTSSNVQFGTITGSSIVKSGGTSSQFLKADGSVDSSTYLTAHPTITGAGDDSVSASTATFIDGITVDGNGHITATSTSTALIGVTDGNLIDTTTTNGNVSINVDLSELTDMTQSVDRDQDELVILDNGSQKRKLISEIPISALNNDGSALNPANFSEKTSFDHTGGTVSTEDTFIVSDNTASGAGKRVLAGNIPLSAFNNDSNFSTTVGTVTSVIVSGSDGIEVDSGSPITSSGTIALGVNAASLRTHINVADGATANTGSLADQDTVGTSDIDDDAVTYAKIQNVSATNRILGRDSAGAGVIEEIAPADVLTMLGVETGATADQTDSEIETAYNNQVSQVSPAERTSGTATGIRRYAPADIKSMIDTHQTDTVYSHPSHDGDDIDIDTGALTGATVISDLDLNVTTDTLGHVTDANATVSTRTLTLANLGFTGDSDATDDQTASEITALLNDVASYSLGTTSSGTITVNNDMTVSGNLTVTGTTTTTHVETTTTSNGVVFEGSVDDANDLTLKAGTVSDTRTITLPDASGTVALTSQLHDSVTLANTNYLSISGQQITGGTVPVSSGGTGSTTAPMVGVITAADASAARTVLGLGAAAVKTVATDGSSGVSDGETGLVTGNAVFDYIAAQNFSQSGQSNFVIGDITGQTELTSGNLTSADEFVISDDGGAGTDVLKRISVSTLEDYMHQPNATTATGDASSTDHYAKLLTFNPGGQTTRDCNLILGVTAHDQGAVGSAIISVKFRSNGATTQYTADVAFMSKSGTSIFDEDAFQIFSDGNLVAQDNNTDMELWVKKNNNYSSLEVHELSKAITGGSATLTYHTDSAWQSSAPTNNAFTTTTQGIELNLDVIRMGTTALPTYLYLNPHSNSANSFLLATTAGDVTLAADDDLVLHADDDIIFQSGGSTQMTFLNTGELGIGTTTPDEALEIMNGTLKITREETENSVLTEDYVTLDVSNGLKWTFSQSFDNPNPVPIGTTTDNDVRIIRYNQTHQYFYWDRTYFAKKVGIGTTTVDASLHVKNTGDGSTTMILENTNASANEGPILDLYRSSASPAVDDMIGTIKFTGENDADEKVTYGEIQAFIEDETDLTENAAFQFRLFEMGTARENLRIASNQITFNNSERNVDVLIKSDDGSTNFFSDATNNRIGIGTTSPETLLHLSAADPVLKITDTTGSDNRASIWLQESDSFGARLAYESSGNDFFNINIIDSGTETTRMVIDRYGRMGIGTTSPLHRLHVSGSGAQKIKVESTDNEAAIELASDSSGPWVMYSANGSDDLRWYGNSAVRMSLTSAGNLGIGTTAPAYQLEVEGSANSYAQFTAGNNTGYSGLLFGDSDANAVGRVQYYHTDDRMTFYTNASEQMRITSAGNVGIGTTSPSTNLHISDDSTSLITGLLVENVGSAGNSATVAGIEIKNGAGTDSSTHIEQDAFGQTIMYTGQGAKNEFLRVSSDAGTFTVAGDLKLGGNDIIASDGTTAISTSGADVTVAGGLTVSGDLTVGGTTTTLNTQTIEVEDNIIQLNTTQGSPDTATNNVSGFEIYRGDGVNVASFKFEDNQSDRWQLYNGTASMDFYMTGGVSEMSANSNSLYLTTKRDQDDIHLRTGTTETTRLFVEGDTGRVGIGTTSPEGELHVAGSAIVDYAIAHGGESGQNRIIFTTNTQSFQTGGTDRMVIASSGAVSVAGAFSAATKSFDIEHPTKEGMRLHHGSLEGPEHGVYVRGRLEGDTIELPDYWLGLVDEDTITVQLTPNKGFQQIYVDHIEDNKVYVGTQTDTPIDCFYFIQAERKDVDKMEVEY